MTITLPEEMREELEQKAKAAGFATVAEYVAELVHADEISGPIPEPPAGARYSVSTREELEAKLLEGMNREGDVTAGPDFWEQRRRAAEEQMAKGNLSSWAINSGDVSVFSARRAGTT